MQIGAQDAILIAGAYLVLVNVLCFFLFGLDKRKARASASRVPEVNLLRLAVIGGSLGAKAGQRYFRHKTRKQPFARILNTIMVCQLLMLSLIVWASL